MNIRKSGYRDYYMTDDEAKKIKKYCKEKASQYEKEILLKCAQASNKDISDLLYFSIALGVSYDKICLSCYIPIKKDDFYGYQRNTIYRFRDMMAMENKINF